MRKWATTIDPTFVPSEIPKPRKLTVLVLTDEQFAALPDDGWPAGETDIFAYLREAELIESYQGVHINYADMFDIIHPIAEADKRKYGL